MPMETSDGLSSVLVVGGCGFLGHHIVTILGIRTDHHRVDGAYYVTGSITSYNDAMRALNAAKPKVIFHTVSAPPLGDTKLFPEVNIEGTRNLLKCAQEYGIAKALVYTSSSSVIHDNRSDLVSAKEDMPLIYFPRQPEIYSHTKAIAEKMVLDANKVSAISTCAIRPSGIFGENDRTLTGNLITSAKEGKANIQIGDNSKLFDFTYVENTAHAHLLAARGLLRTQIVPVEKELKVDGEAFVITNDDPWPFWNFSRALVGAAGYPVKKEKIRVIPVRVMWVIVVVIEYLYWVLTFEIFDITKAKMRLGYSPLVSMKEGIQRTGLWYKKICKEERDSNGGPFRKIA
ncbi:hypothetical protein BDV95DRAFT_628198 [Massariosphaeria phaeospora]|uniref:3-beta hydroxysteroid dehydrogenase/isomerase domain-containing protein n=1 Tax=Massariosphaeria phaeospora TaxID=100035 RepID=A0A7C8M9A5_9PLEO|nr:hypothetical protein BDV95DRAFT_628198 [Massariosphaeria phaeospora]